MKTFNRTIARISPRIVSLVMLVALLLISASHPAHAESRYWECPASQQVTIGLDEIIAFETQEPDGDEPFFVVTGNSYETGWGDTDIDIRRPYPNDFQTMTEGFYCLQDDDQLVLKIRLMEADGQNYAELLGEFEVRVVNEGHRYWVQWCSWDGQTKILSESTLTVEQCYEANSANVYSTQGGASYGMHLSLWFSASNPARRGEPSYRMRPYAGPVLSLYFIKRLQLLEEEGNAVATATATPVPPTPPPIPTPQNLTDQMVSAIRANRSGITNPYPAQAEQLAQGLAAHLSEFQLSDADITAERMSQILRKDDAAMRIHAVVNGVWGDWDVNLCQKYGWNQYSEDPSGKVRPFRQLIIRLIQGRQGALSEAEQRALESFFTRSEDFNTLQNDMKAIVGAINQVYFPQ